MSPTRTAEHASTELHLDANTLELLAARVAELLAGRLELATTTRESPVRLLSAAEVSEWWGVTRGWVYQHADRARRPADRRRRETPPALRRRPGREAPQPPSAEPCARTKDAQPCAAITADQRRFPPTCFPRRPRAIVA